MNEHHSLKAILVFASKHGQTEKIISRIADVLDANGITSDIFEIDQAPFADLSNYQMAIIGTPVYATKTNKRLQHWVAKNRLALGKLITGFFTVSLNAADLRLEARQADRQIILKFINSTMWYPSRTKSLSGALNYLDYNYFLRFIMRQISKRANGPTDTTKNYDLTDWKDVENFALDLIADSKKPTQGNRIYGSDLRTY